MFPWNSMYKYTWFVRHSFAALWIHRVSLIQPWCRPDVLPQQTFLTLATFSKNVLTVFGETGLRSLNAKSSRHVTRCHVCFVTIMKRHDQSNMVVAKNSFWSFFSFVVFSPSFLELFIRVLSPPLGVGCPPPLGVGYPLQEPLSPA